MCLVVGFVALGACTGTTTPASTAPSDDLPPGVALSFVQQHGSQGSPHAQLRVTNGSHSEMFVSGIGLVASIAYTIPALTPDTTSAETLHAGFMQFLWGMLAIFLFSGIGNASTFKQMPMIFEKRQAGGVIGWTAAIAAFGPFFFGIGVTLLGPTVFYLIGIAFALMCIAITWVRYARKGAPKPS